MYIDATIIKGKTKGFSCSIQVTDGIANPDPSVVTHDNLLWTPVDLSDYAIGFKILGAPTADAKVLVEKVITANTDIETVGQITYPEEGQFTFVVTAEDTHEIGLGNHPIMLELLDLDSLTTEYTLTEGGRNGEYSKIQVVQV